MKNSFDDKIKEALENFEMPYDANAWAEFEQQLPKTPVAGGNVSGAFSTWKIAAVVAIIAVVTSVWYFNQGDLEQTVQSEQTIPNNPSTVKQHEGVIEGEADKSEPASSEKADEVKSVSKSAEVKQTTTETDGIADVDEEIFRSSENDELTETVEDTEPNNLIAPSAIETTTTSSNESPISVNFIASMVTACVNQDVSFINESDAKSAEMIWDFGDGNTSTEKDPIHNYVAPGNYTVTLSVEGNQDVFEKSVDIKVNPVPTAVFSAERKLNGYQAIPLYNFSTATQPNERAIWSFSDGLKVSGTEATHLFRSAGKHTAKLTITNNFGCSTSVDQEFTTQKFNLLAPTAFTPDRDGINETFIPKALPEMGLDFEMTIQNPRTGQVVFRTDNYTESWDGTLNNSGVELENGIYVWTVVLKENVVSNRVFTETINLQR